MQTGAGPASPDEPPSPYPGDAPHEHQRLRLADPRLPGRSGTPRRAGRPLGTCCIRYARTTRPPARPTTSRRTSPRTAAFRGRPITAKPSFTWARMPWPRSRTSRSTRCTTSMRGRRTFRRIAGTASSPTARSLVKEVTRSARRSSPRGSPTWTKDIKIWFVMIKDAKGRFPGNDLWGDGWGWALFEAKEPEAKRGDRLHDRLQDVPRPSQEGRLGVHPRIPGA